MLIFIEKFIDKNILETKMHADENKKFDIRNIERNIKNKIITRKDYEIYLSKLADVGDKLFDPEESIPNHSEIELRQEGEIQSKKKIVEKKSKRK